MFKHRHTSPIALPKTSDQWSEKTGMLCLGRDTHAVMNTIEDRFYAPSQLTPNAGAART